jgi:hypothetical protein
MEPSRWSHAAWLPLLAGLAWLFCGARAGWLAFAVAVPPGVMLLTSGGSTFFWPGDRRGAQFAAAGGALGALLAFPSIFTLGLFSALMMCGLSAASFLSAGFSSIRGAALPEGVPEPQPSVKVAARTALDEAVLADLSFSASFPSGDEARRVVEETHAARELFRARGWLDQPAAYHQQPLPLLAPQLRPRRTRGIDFSHLSFESEYEPHAQEPGRERWLSYSRNRTAHAWVLRHEGVQRPWVVCIHGFRMGSPLIDLSAFSPRFFFEKLGLNMIVPVLPLHGPRKMGRRSGDGYLDADVLDTVHAQAQAAWDLRRMLSWLRAEGAPAIGVHGLSLGGYNTALLASLDADLACAIAGIPATDFSRIFWHHGPWTQLRSFESQGLFEEHVCEVFSVVSPLKIDPKVPAAGRAIFGGITDRIVPADQVRDLYEHWDRPAMVWYQGGHLSFDSDPRVRTCLETTLREHLLPAEPAAGLS